MVTSWYFSDVCCPLILCLRAGRISDDEPSMEGFLLVCLRAGERREYFCMSSPLAVCFLFVSVPFCSLPSLIALPACRMQPLHGTLQGVRSPRQSRGCSVHNLTRSRHGKRRTFLSVRDETQTDTRAKSSFINHLFSSSSNNNNNKRALVATQAKPVSKALPATSVTLCNLLQAYSRPAPSRRPFTPL